ncbi:MAG TPA: PH domain-containing protein [Thermoanaerobaculia bacterium]|nr:PH domain-containing protein [Thermoanaerobaculia bacterium]
MSGRAPHSGPGGPAGLDERVFALERPDPALLRYYLVSSLLTGPALPFVLPYRYFRYHTLRYRFDGEGIAMRWGILFRKEINLTYARIQDIHLSSNVVERWLGLARIEIQTASGSAKAEMTIEGILELEELRDFLYSRMRGTRDAADTAARPPAAARPAPAAGSAVSAGPGAEASPELASVLREVAGELRALRSELAAGAGAERRDG